MKIPDHIESLYCHWHKHIEFKPKRQFDQFDQSHIIKLERFATDRMRVWKKKTLGSTPPYTQDLILQNYRFCNIYRELDRQTIGIHQLLNPIKNDFDLWLLNLAFNRFLCSPSTFNKVGFLNFNKRNNLAVMNKILKLSNPKYGSAYVFPISVIMASQFDTREKFFSQYLPLAIPKVAKTIKSFNDIGVSEALEEVLRSFGFNFRFHWTEILIDVAYQFPEKINLFKRFPIGPGSIPTMKLLSEADPELTALALTRIRFKNFPYLQFQGKNVWLSAENWEGIGCEYRKYTNLTAGKGRKRKYIT